MRHERLPRLAISALILAAIGLLGLFHERLAPRASATDPGRIIVVTPTVLGAVELPSPDAGVFLAPATTQVPTDSLSAQSPFSGPGTTMLAAMLAAPAPTSTEPSSAASASATEVGWAGIAQVDYPWRDLFPDWSVSIEPARDGLRALTFPSSKRIEIYVRSSDTETTIARVFAHELGHVVDVERNDDADRARWRDLRGSDAPWWPTESTYDFDTLAGDFAESFATWKVGSTSQAKVAGPPDAAAFALLAELSAP